jgi:hypothetical protein
MAVLYLNANASKYAFLFATVNSFIYVASHFLSGLYGPPHSAVSIRRLQRPLPPRHYVPPLPGGEFRDLFPVGNFGTCLSAQNSPLWRGGNGVAGVVARPPHGVVAPQNSPPWRGAALAAGWLLACRTEWLPVRRPSERAPRPRRTADK